MQPSEASSVANLRSSGVMQRTPADHAISMGSSSGPSQPSASEAGQIMNKTLTAECWLVKYACWGSCLLGLTCSCFSTFASEAGLDLAPQPVNSFTSISTRCCLRRSYQGPCLRQGLLSGRLSQQVSFEQPGCTLTASTPRMQHSADTVCVNSVVFLVLSNALKLKV